MLLIFQFNINDSQCCLSHWLVGKRRSCVAMIIMIIIIIIVNASSLSTSQIGKNKTP